MGKSKVYYLPMDRWADVPGPIEGLSSDIVKKNDFVAIKLHFGEKGNKGFIKPEWVKPVVEWVKTKKAHPYLTDTNTIYRGQRADSVHHLMMAHGHGFKMEKVGAPVIIADGIRGTNFVAVKVDGKHFKHVKIAKCIHETEAMLVLSHTKGHMLAGFGGALKNLGMGCAAKSGKYEMHASVNPQIIIGKCIGCGKCMRWCPEIALSLKDEKISLDKEKCVGCGECIQACQEGALQIPWDVPSKNVQERLVEYAKGAVEGKKVCYVNYMHHITKNCDCLGSDEEPVLPDQGILVSTDPVAIDQASIDIITKAAGKDILKELNDKDYGVQIAYAEELGMGSREYELIK